MPRIVSNLALVRSLRGSNVQPPTPRIATTPQPKPAAPPPAPSSQATVTASAPAVERKASVGLGDSPSPARAERPSASAVNAVPPPANANTVQPRPKPAASLASNAPQAIPPVPTPIERSTVDPSAQAEAVPKDPKASPVAPKKAVAKRDAAPAPPSLSVDGFILRPALSEGKPTQQANAQTK